MASAETLPGHSDATKESLQPLTCGLFYISECQLGSRLQETNALTLQSNNRLAVANELKKIPEENCITMQYTVMISRLIRD
jgi:hypothetical protein